MKIKHILVSLVAILTIAAGCNQIEPEHYLSEIQVSSSYLSFPADGGSVSIGYTANGSWNVSGLPEYISASPASGGAGEGTISFSASAAKDTRQGSFLLTCDGVAQTINFIQVTKKMEPVTMTVKQALEVIRPLADREVASGNYRIKGIVCKINEISPQYGNATYFLSDDGSYSGSSIADCNWIQVYRGLWLNGSAFTKGDEFAIGDELTIEGLIMNYSGTPETKEKEAYVVSVNKSLIKIDSVEPADATVPAEGGEYTVTLTNKGEGIYVEIPEEVKDWLSISAIAGNAVKFYAAPNAGGERQATIVFKTTDGKKEYSTQQTLIQKGSIVDVSIAEFLAAKVGDGPFRMTGVITSYYPSDNQGQSFYIRDWSGETLAYRVDNFKDSGLELGDIITVTGKRGAYKENPQVVSGTIEDVVAVVEEVSLADFLTKPDNKNVYYMVTGTVKDLLDNKGKENVYGNLHLTDGANELYVYGCYSGWGATGDARKGFIESKGIREGDQLTMIGYKDTYNGLIELCGGIYFSHKSANAEQ